MMATEVEHGQRKTLQRGGEDRRLAHATDELLLAHEENTRRQKYSRRSMQLYMLATCSP